MGGGDEPPLDILKDWMYQTVLTNPSYPANFTPKDTSNEYPDELDQLQYSSKIFSDAVTDAFPLLSNSEYSVFSTSYDASASLSRVWNSS
jgi:hypothetical protein